MTDVDPLILPDYHQKSAGIEARFAELYQRPVALRVDGLTRIFDSADGPVVAIEDITCNIHRREFLSVVGPSGCGKSTLIRNIAGLDRPTRGVVKVYGDVVSGPGPDRGMVFQSYTLFPWLSVKRNVMFGLLRTGKDRDTAESEAVQWIELVGLRGFENAYPHQLSGGMKQRVAIARALANRPRVLLMDEPFGALDAQTRANMQAYLLQIWHNVDVTILFITHDLEEAVYLSDRILVLKAHPGRIDEIVEVPVPRPRHPDQFISPAFLATTKHIKELIHPPDEAKEAPLPILKLTPVGDEVE
jgi:NitT/TauT family transport system ATP-binding protein